MSALLLEAPPRSAGVDGARGPRRFGRREPTLEERLDGVLRTVLRSGVAECPVCRAAMRPQGAAARCGGCGSVVS